MELFRLKLLESTGKDIKNFLKINKLNYVTISEDEKNEVREGLNDSTVGHDAGEIDILDFYKVPFLEVLDLIKNRRCFVKNGYAYVNSNDFISVLCTKHQEIMEKGLEHARLCARYLQDDERFTTLISNLHLSYTGNEVTVSKDAVPIESLDQLSKKSYPLCMRICHDAIRTKHHIKHSGRMQYGLFLKGIGVTLEDSLKFWRQEFIKSMDPDKFDKAYAYNIRHNYGKAGSMRDYTPYSCQKIINTAIPPQDVCGCPFKTFDSSNLRLKLTSYGFGMAHTHEVVSLASKGHYQLACARYFEITHDVNLEQGINHPNSYFSFSQEILNKKHANMSSASKQRNSSKFGTQSQSIASSQMSQSSQLQTQADEDQLMDQLLMDIDY